MTAYKFIFVHGFTLCKRSIDEYSIRSIKRHTLSMSTYARDERIQTIAVYEGYKNSQQKRNVCSLEPYQITTANNNNTSAVTNKSFSNEIE